MQIPPWRLWIGSDRIAELGQGQTGQNGIEMRKVISKSASSWEAAPLSTLKVDTALRLAFIDSWEKTAQ